MLCWAEDNSALLMLERSAGKLACYVLGGLLLSNGEWLLDKPDLLCCDELGYLSYSNRHADLLFEIISRRYQEKPTLVTTNKQFTEWREMFPNASCVVSLIDRLVHNSEIVSIDAESYRLKEAKEQNLRRKESRAKRKNNPNTKKREIKS